MTLIQRLFLIEKRALFFLLFDIDFFLFQFFEKFFLQLFFLDFLIFYVAVRPNLAVLNLCLKSRGGGATVVSQMQRDSIFIYKSS